MTTQTPTATLTTDERLARLEGAFDQMNKRIGDLARSITIVYILLGGLWASMAAGFIGIAALILQL